MIIKEVSILTIKIRTMVIKEIKQRKYRKI